MSEILREIEKSRQVVRKKYKKLRRFQGLAKQQIAKNLEPLITPLRHLVDLEIKQENGGGQPIIKSEPFKPESAPSQEESDDERISDDSNITLDGTLANNGNITAITSTPKAKGALFTQGASTSQDVTIRRPTQNTNTLISRYMRELITKNDNDIAFGPKLDPSTEKFTLGTVPFDVDEKNDKVRVGDHVFQSSVGLLELIFKSHPQDVNEKDEQVYSEIMKISGLHLNSNNRVKSNRGEKYTKYIKKLKDQTISEKNIPQQNLTTFYDASEGNLTGGNLRAQYSEKPVQFVYWDNPNELVDRLHLLISERDAGHSGVDGEIISILEELSERGFIINSGKSRLFPAF